MDSSVLNGMNLCTSRAYLASQAAVDGYFQASCATDRTFQIAADKDAANAFRLDTCSRHDVAANDNFAMAGNRHSGSQIALDMDQRSISQG